MNTQVSVKDQVWKTLLEYMQSTKDFVLEQAPDVIRQALQYEKISTYVGAALVTLSLTAVIFIAYYFWKHPVLDKYGSREFGSFLGVLIPLCVTPLLVGQFFFLIDKLIKIHIAPKYFLINLIINLKNQ